MKHAMFFDMHTGAKVRITPRALSIKGQPKVIPQNILWIPFIYLNFVSYFIIFNMSINEAGFQEYLLLEGTFQLPIKKVVKYDSGNLPLAKREQDISEKCIDKIHDIDFVGQASKNFSLRGHIFDCQL